MQCKETVDSSLKAILNYVASLLKDICPAAIPGCNFAANVEKEKRVCMVFAAIKADVVSTWFLINLSMRLFVGKGHDQTGRCVQCAREEVPG